MQILSKLRAKPLLITLSCKRIRSSAGNATQLQVFRFTQRLQGSLQADRL
jgi:hypothetical protein